MCPIREFILKVFDERETTPLILTVTFAGEERAMQFVKRRLRDVPAIDAVEVWEGETKLARIVRSEDRAA